MVLAQLFDANILHLCNIVYRPAPVQELMFIKLYIRACWCINAYILRMPYPKAVHSLSLVGCDGHALLSTHVSCGNCLSCGRCLP